MTILSTKVHSSETEILEAQKHNVHREPLKRTAIRIHKTIFYSTLKISDFFFWINGLNKNVRIFRHLSLKHNFNNGGLHVLVVRILLSREWDMAKEV